MSLWCDKYQPKTFDELDFQLEQAELLKNIVIRKHSFLRISVTK